MVNVQDLHGVGDPQSLQFRDSYIGGESFWELACRQ